MAEKTLWYLENIDVASIFCPRKMNMAQDALQHRQFRKKEYIYVQHDDADKVYLLTEGRVRIGTYNTSGKEITKAILTKGEVFGELAVMEEGKRSDFACAIEQTTVCILLVDEMRRLMREHNGINVFFMRLMGSRLLEMEHRLESLVFKDSRSRIIELLADIAVNRGQRIGDEYVVRNFITHKDIASLTATSRQTVGSVMNELRDKNIIAFDRRQLLIRDLEQLK